jgi:predicted transcriptional regulator
MTKNANNPNPKLLNAIANTTKYRILEILLNEEKPLNIRTIAKLMQQDYSVIYRHVETLEETGIITIYEVGRSRVPHITNKETIKQIITDLNQLSTLINKKTTF